MDEHRHTTQAHEHIITHIQIHSLDDAMYLIYNTFILASYKTIKEK
jgi:hypothetical protein